MNSIKPYAIYKVRPSQLTSPQPADDWVVCEEPLEIWLKFQPKEVNAPNAPELLFTTMRTPGDDINLVKGWLLSSGAIRDKEQIVSVRHTGVGRLKQQATNQVLVTLSEIVDISPYQRLEVVNSACGVCGQQSIENLLESLPPKQAFSDSNLKPSVDDIYALTQKLQTQQVMFNQTGGNHGAALFDGKMQVLDVREDVGRHNALDKLIGANLDKPSALGIVVSGRVSFELIQKAAVVGVRFVVAIGAPSSLAIDLAQDCDMCLLGFVKSTGLNIYTNKDMLAL